MAGSKFETLESDFSAWNANYVHVWAWSTRGNEENLEKHKKNCEKFTITVWKDKKTLFPSLKFAVFCIFNHVFRPFQTKRWNRGRVLIAISVLIPALLGKRHPLGPFESREGDVVEKIALKNSKRKKRFEFYFCFFRLVFLLWLVCVCFFYCIFAVRFVRWLKREIDGAKKIDREEHWKIQ